MNVPKNPTMALPYAPVVYILSDTARQWKDLDGVAIAVVCNNLVLGKAPSPVCSAILAEEWWSACIHT